MQIGNSGVDRALLGSFGAVFLLATNILAVAQPAHEKPQLQVGLAAAADFSAIYPNTVFRSPITELSASFRLDEKERPTRLSARWIAVDVGAAAPQNFQIAAAELELKGMTSGRFRYEQPQPLPVGRYRVEVDADGKPWQSAQFEIIAAGAVPSPPAGQALVPLAPGQQWTYRFEQRAGRGARLDPSLAMDADGAYRATVKLRVAGQDVKGAHLITARNDDPVFEEWWRLDKAGLWATRRKEGTDDIVLNPPQRLLAAPGTDQKWTYPPFRQDFRMWGPLPMSGAWGSGDGYVVLLRQPADKPMATVERHFVPGVGMVREVIIQSIAGRLISRQEMELMKQ